MMINKLSKKACFMAMALVFVLTLISSFSFLFTSVYAEAKVQRLVDNADVLTDSEEKSLLAKLNEISELLKMRQQRVVLLPMQMTITIIMVLDMEVAEMV